LTEQGVDEFALIQRYFQRPAQPTVALGIGDDAALIDPPAGHQLAICTDTLVAGRHFAPDAAGFDIGWKSLAVNLSDLAAMGAKPQSALLALTLPEADASWLKAFSEGFFALAEAHGVALIGGDTTRGPLSITVTAIGMVPSGRALRRDGARVGDMVCVTGTLGDAAAALSGIDSVAMAMRLHRPEPRVAAGALLREHASAAIDVSDGLLADLGHVCAASNVGADLRDDLLPASEALLAAVPDAGIRLRHQLGGDDYELCLCLPPDNVTAAIEALAAVGVPLHVIGRVAAEPGVRLRTADGTLMPQAHSGYKHFE
jgi:thiamine-monophosphate kinase